MPNGRWCGTSLNVKVDADCRRGWIVGSWSMRVSTSCAPDVHGAWCPKSLRVGRTCIAPFGAGANKQSSNRCAIVCAQWRKRQEREIGPTAAVLYAQSTRSSPQGGASGYDAGKKVKGRKRHLIVDTLGLLLAVSVTAASVQG